MRTNIEIDDALMALAQRSSGCRTKKDTVEMALRLLVKQNQPAVKGILALVGKVEWEGDLNTSREGRNTL